MIDSNYSKKPTDEDLTRVYKLGRAIISEHNKYKKYTSSQTWAVGLGSLIGNYDVRDYDPEEYSSIELIVLALQNNFKDIGGPGVGAIEYIKLLRKYYPKTSSRVLRLSLASSVDDCVIRPIIITDTYHPKLSRLYVMGANDGAGEKSIHTDEDLEYLRNSVDDIVADLIFGIVSE